MKFASKVSQEKLLLAILACIQFSHILDFVIIMPLGPQLMRVFSIGPSEFGWIVSSYTFSAGASGFLSAILIDKFDRKHFLNFAYAGFLIGTLLCGFSESYTFLLLARILAGAFAGIVNSCTFAYIGDKIPYERRGKASGVVMSAFSVASVAGVPLGLILSTKYNWRVPFYSLFVLGSIFGFVSLFLLPNSTKHLEQGENNKLSPLASLFAIFNNRNHIVAFAFIMCITFSSFSVIPYIATYMVFNTGMAEKALSYVYLIGGGSTLVTARIIGRLSDTYGKATTFRTVASFSIIPIIAITHLSKIPLLYILCISTLFFILVSGRMIPAMAMITSSVSSKNRGSFMSINSSMQQLASGMASTISGLIIHKTTSGSLQNYNYVGYLACIFILISVCIAGKLRVSS
ncbi:MAG: MFS transporter [Spirochaetota bacterium]